MNDVTVVITACNRSDSLRIAFDSFVKYNTYPIKKYIIIEDSGYVGINDFVKELYPDLEILLIYNEENIGQPKSIDKAYSYVDSEYIFHMEEDWEFYDSGFIEYSMEVLRDSSILLVWLRADGDTNGHPIEEEVFVIGDGIEYRLMSLGYLGRWHGFTWNPSLIHYENNKKIGSYSRFGDAGIRTETNSSNFYKNLGYRAGKCKESGYVRHIG
jgi:GT2 family glycosyltransferase